ncbi:MAG: carbohydrate porin [Myxococcales bacterium]|jgi:maltoporin|nr:carbohydrate porin [Myxococcales bacterium]
MTHHRAFLPSLVTVALISLASPAVSLAQPQEQVDQAQATAAPTPTLPPAFQFGSYGNIQFGTDLQGKTGRQTNVTSRGPRLIEPSYQELHFRYRLLVPANEIGTKAKLVTTIALGQEAFHYTGEFDVSLALRNMFVQVDDLFWKDFGVWVGSRMYRGDDIYLLDYWPLDNLNTLGGGFSLKVEKLEIAAHVGVNRLDNDYQLQIIESPSHDTIGAVSDALLDRQRSIVSLRLTYPLVDTGLARLYVERHDLPSGEKNEPTSGAVYAWPRDSGWVVGAQLKGWTGDGLSGSLWLKFGAGLGAYGEMTTPFGLALDRKAADAKLFTAAFSGTLEKSRFAIPLAAYVSLFRDASGLENNARDYEEVVVNLRPTVFLHKQFHLALDASYQLRAPHTFSDDGKTPVRAQVVQFGLMPSFVPSADGFMGRPTIRAIYAIRLLNADARQALYGSADERIDRKVDHFLGLSAEWWFNVD